MVTTTYDWQVDLGAMDDSELHKLVQKVVQQVLGGSRSETAPANPPGVTGKENSSPQSAGSSASTAAATKVVAIGSDHGGFDLKDNLKAYLTELGYDVRDVGAYNKGAVDYPDFAHEVARQVATGKAWRGIMIDGAGIGSCIVANKVPGVRAGMAYD